MVDKREDITFQWEPVCETIEEFNELYKDHMKVIYGVEDIDLSQIIALERAGIIAQATARCNGLPAGYYIVALSPCLYNPRIIEAKDIAIYTKKEYRGKGVSKVLTEMVEDECRKAGARSILCSYPYKATLPEKMGYQPKEYIYERSL